MHIENGAYESSRVVCINFLNVKKRITKSNLSAAHAVARRAVEAAARAAAGSVALQQGRVTPT